MTSSETVAETDVPRQSYDLIHFVHWFRKGLRLSDNPSLLRGIRNCSTFRCIFILDSYFTTRSTVGINKWRFLLQSLEDLDTSLRKLNSRLFVVRGQPCDILPRLFKKWGTNLFSFETDPEPYGKIRDEKITAMCRNYGIRVLSESSHTLYDLDELLERNGGKTPLTFHQFVELLLSIGPPKHPCPTVNSSMVKDAFSPIDDDHDIHFRVPSVQELGFDECKAKSAVWPGGETEAIRKLEGYLERKVWLSNTGNPKITTCTTGLSCYLRFGCLSVKLFYHSLANLYRKVKNAEPSLTIFNQLLWRELFYIASTKNANFDRMVGNPICLQIPWDKDPQALASWASSKTGFPWIDAIMAQLRDEGWIHNVCRQSVACFLTRGDLWLSWEDGMKVFDELLLDADYSVNAGSWMWHSCSSFFQQFLQIYCPVEFGRKLDPKGDYIRHYLPVLKQFPSAYIHEPWMAPESVQKASNCIIGVDYPLPIVDHQKISKINQERMRQIFQQLSAYTKFNLPGPDEQLHRISSEEVEKVEKAFRERVEHVQTLNQQQKKKKIERQTISYRQRVQKFIARQLRKRSSDRQRSHTFSKFPRNDSEYSILSPSQHEFVFPTENIIDVSTRFEDIPTTLVDQPSTSNDIDVFIESLQCQPESWN